MRILMSSRCFYPAMASGGMAQKVSAIARALVRRGHDVIVYTSDVRDVRSRLFDRTQMTEWEGVRVIYFHTVVHYRWDGVQPDLFRHLDGVDRCDVLHVYGVRDFLSTVLCWVARRRGVPYVVEPMGMLPRRGRSRRKKWLYDRLFGRTLVDGAARVIVTSAQEAREASEWGVPRSKLVLRRNGIDLSEFRELPPRGTFRARLGLSAEEHLVLYMGRLARVKNLPLLIEACAALRRPSVQLVIVGPDDGDGTRSEIERAIARLRLEGAVHVLGPLYHRERVSALVDADVFVLPSHHESFGTVAAEALACGTPVIVTTRCGIAPLIAGRAGLVVEPEKEAVADALARLLNDDALRRQFSEAARAMCSALSWEEPIEELERLYAEVARASREVEDLEGTPSGEEEGWPSFSV